MDLDQTPGRPDICLGTDGLHTPPTLVDELVSTCAALGWSIEVNRPYAGTLIPTTYYHRDARVRSVMIEANRRLYLSDEPRDVSKSASWDHARQGIWTLIARALEAL